MLHGGHVPGGMCWGAQECPRVGVKQNQHFLSRCAHCTSGALQLGGFMEKSLHMAGGQVCLFGPQSALPMNCMYEASGILTQ